jgi:hypothetical protein
MGTRELASTSEAYILYRALRGHMMGLWIVLFVWVALGLYIFIWNEIKFVEQYVCRSTYTGTCLKFRIVMWVTLPDNQTDLLPSLVCRLCVVLKVV